MKLHLPKPSRMNIYAVLWGVLCIALNVGLCYITTALGLPLYFDTIGTILMAFIWGSFPAITIAVATSLLCSLFSQDALYFALIGVFIAIRSARYVQNERYRKRSTLCLIADLALISGIIGTGFQWLLLGEPQFAYVSDTAKIMSGQNRILYFLAALLLVVALNMVDKGISVIAAKLIYRLVPVKTRQSLWNSRWKQTPLTLSEIKKINANIRKGGTSFREKVVLLLMSVALPLTIILGILSARINYNYLKEDGKKIVVDVSKYAASVLDPSDFRRFIRDGQPIQTYSNVKYQDYNHQLNSIKKAFPEIEYLYVYDIREDACYLIFDTDENEQSAGTVGEKIEFDESFLPMIPDLLQGKEIDVLEIESRYGYFLTAYEPIKDSFGLPTSYYVGADLSLENYPAYIKDFVIKMVLAFSGFFALILSYGLWTAVHDLVYPLGCLEESIDGLMKSMDDQDELDDSVKSLERLDICTGDELERLYKSVCEMANTTAEQIRSIQILARSNEKMQTGLILTMADIFENQSINSSAHIKKTSEYVRIILEGLRHKGYYAEKLTDKFMSDVEMSAPLYDIGKIKIPDAILNKPGPLTEEERELMRTHTTAGKKILENAITSVEGENYLKEARNMAGYHHEHWDGSGYPVGLHGEVIPLSARIMAIADAFDELTSPRVYRTAVSAQEALEQIQENSGRKFDPRCVEAFTDSFTQVKNVLRKYPEE